MNEYYNFGSMEFGGGGAYGGTPLYGRWCYQTTIEFWENLQ